MLLAYTIRRLPRAVLRKLLRCKAASDLLRGATSVSPARILTDGTNLSPQLTFGRRGCWLLQPSQELLKEITSWGTSINGRLQPLLTHCIHTARQQAPSDGRQQAATRLHSERCCQR